MFCFSLLSELFFALLSDGAIGTQTDRHTHKQTDKVWSSDSLPDCDDKKLPVVFHCCAVVNSYVELPSDNVEDSQEHSIHQPVSEQNSHI